MPHRKVFLVLIWANIFAASELLAQTHFSFTSNTGNNATVAIPTSANPSINGTPLAVNDEIGAFTPAGLCAGAVVWTGSNVALTVWGDNDITPAIDGMQSGEQILYRVWHQSTNTEYSAVSVTYSQGSGNYAVNGIYALSSLAAVGPPSPPTLSSPPNGAAGVSTGPTLTWNASSGATSYGLQVSTNSTFSSTLVNLTGITSTSSPVSGLANGSTYYWRVNAANTSGTSNWSTVWSFVTSGGTPPPVPTLSSPSNGATGISTSPTLTWNASSGATSYGLQVSTSSSFTSTVVNLTGITTTSSAISGLANNTTYYWRVNAANAGGTSAYSGTWSFTTATAVSPPPAPTLSSPSNAATGISTSPTLTWNASSGAASYGLQVSTSSSFTTMVVNENGLTNTSEAVSGLTNSTTYYWRVNATNGGGTSGYSSTWSFTTVGGGGSPPAAPALASPQNAATGISPSPTLTWNASSGATSYHLEISTNSSFSTIDISQSGITGTSYGVTGLADGTTYYWRMNALNGAGTSPYSEIWSFTTTIMPLAPVAAPALASPEDGATSVSAEPTLSWSDASGAISYQLQVSTSASFITTVINRGGISETWIRLSGLRRNTTHYWRVCANYGAGTGPYSSVRSFTTVIASPVAPNLLSPIDGAVNVSTRPTFVWGQSTGASSYQLQVSTDPSFSTIVMDRSGITATSLTLSGLDVSTVYYWRVNASNAGGPGEWSSVRHMTTSNVSAVSEWNGIPEGIRLFQNFPNPFNNSTIISYELPKPALVSIEVYSVLGQKVATLEQGIKQPGYHRVSWESSLSSGVYHYTLVIDGSRLPAKTMVYVR